VQTANGESYDYSPPYLSLGAISAHQV